METKNLKDALTTYKKILKVVLPYLWNKNTPRLKLRFVAAVILIALTIVANLITPLVFGHLINSLKQADVATIGISVLIGYALVWMISQVLVQIRGLLGFKIVRTAIRKLSLDVFQHLHSLSYDYHTKRKIGEITSNIDRIEYCMTSIFWNILFYLSPTILEVTAILTVISLTFAPIYAAILFTGIASFLIFTFSCTSLDTRLLRNANAEMTTASGIATDSLLNYETAKYFAQENHEVEKYNQALTKRQTASLKSDYLFESIFLGQGIIVGITMLAITIVSGLNVQHGLLSLGGFVALNAYLIRITYPLAFLGYTIRDLKNSTGSMEGLADIFEEHSNISEINNAPELNIKGAKLKFDHVSFKYHSDRVVLQDITFEIESGKHVAIVGHSGAGKSTISKLLLRFYDVNSGAIRLDDQDISKVSLSSLRRCIGIVPQETNLFNDSIYYNISYSSPLATKDEVIEAARMAKIHDFIISLPDGYETLVGERGVKLSGGEKQRIAIARAILKKPQFLLFDEATSSLDTVTEKHIQESIREISQGVTTLTIAHRLSTVTNADLILVLEKGRIVERGDHQQLMSLDGIYKEMYCRQTIKNEKSKQESNEFADA